MSEEKPKTEKRLLVAFYLKSGNVVRVKMKSWGRTGNAYHSSLEWKNAGFPQLKDIDLEQIEAIVHEGEEAFDPTAEDFVLGR